MFGKLLENLISKFREICSELKLQKSSKDDFTLTHLGLMDDFLKSAHSVRIVPGYYSDKFFSSHHRMHLKCPLFEQSLFTLPLDFFCLQTLTGQRIHPLFFLQFLP